LVCDFSSVQYVGDNVKTIETEERLLRVEEFARRLEIKDSTARAWLLARRVSKVRVGRRSIRVPESEVTRIIREGFVPAREARDAGR
jgi:excisionase family DNA binding protein